MGMMKFSVPHTLSQEEAQKRLEALIAHWSQKYGIQHRWTGPTASVSGKVMGMNLDASVRVSGQSIDGETSDPGILLRGQAKKYLEERLRKYLDPARSVADLHKVD